MPLFPRLRSKANQRIRDRLKVEAIAKGATEAEVDHALDEMETERPFIDWLLNGGFEQIFALLMKLIALFATQPPEPVPSSA